MTRSFAVGILINLFCLNFIFAADNNCGDKYLQPIYEELSLTIDVLYGNNITSEGDSMDLFMDIFEPEGDTSALRPLVIYLHGGSFTSGSRQMPEAYFICEDFAHRGYVSSSISYRQEPSLLSLLSQEAMIKAVFRASEDFKASVRYFFKSAKEDGNPFRIDTNRIIVGGASAGSIAVLHGVYISNSSELPERFQKYMEELNIDADFVGNSGNKEYSFKTIGVINVSGALQNKTFLDNDTIPLVSIHNEVDFTIPYVEGNPYSLPLLPVVRGSYTLHKYYKKLGQKTTLYTVPGIGHVPYKNDEGKVQPIYDNTIKYMTTFAQSLFTCKEDIPTSIVEDLSLIGSIFPNPTSDFINLSVNDSEQYYVEIINTLGQNIYSTNFQNQISIDVSAFSSKGILIIKLTNTEDKSLMYFTKIIVN